MRKKTEPEQPTGYQDSIQFARCIDDILYVTHAKAEALVGKGEQRSDERTSQDINYWIYLYYHGTDLYALEYCKLYNGSATNYTDPIVEQVFLSVRPKMRSEAELYYEQYEALVGQDLESALEALEKAIEADSSIALYYNRYAQGLLAKGRNEEALSAAQKALTLEPLEPAFHSELSIVLSVLGRHDEAIEAIDKAVAIAPDNAYYHYIRANRRSSAGRYSEAVDEARVAIKLNSSDAYYWKTLATNLVFCEQFDEALKAIDKAIGLEPNTRDLYRIASTAAWRKEDGNKAD